MAKLRGDREAFGRPGMDPRWTHGCKDGVGTAYAASSRIWFTLWCSPPHVLAAVLSLKRK